MKDLTIAQAKDATRRLEGDITTLIQDFERQTGCSVSSVELLHLVDKLSGRQSVGAVTVRAILPND